MSRKEREFSFPKGGKETIQDRLKTLMKGRSLRKVSQEWGFPYSTLNNYFAKGTTPGVDVVSAVAKIENVSLEWLITGSEAPTSQTTATSKQTVMNVDTLRSAWLTAFEFMNKVEAEALLKIIISGGARGLIKLAEKESNLEEAFMMLSPEMKERAMAIVDAHIEAKKGVSPEGGIDEPNQPALQKKQAS